MKNKISVKDIIQRLKTSLKINSDEKLAEIMGVSRPTVTNWKARNSIDFALIFELFSDLDLNWVIYGVSYRNNDVFNCETIVEKHNSFNSSDIEITILKNKIETLENQLHLQREDYVGIIERIITEKQKTEIKPNINLTA